MKIKSELLFPAELTPGDEILDPHEGHDTWAKVVAICSGNQELLVWCDRADEPVHLPASHRVRAKHVVADFMADDTDLDSTDFEARMAGWYAGDLQAATAAAAAHRSHHEPHAEDQLKLSKKLNALYAGDLDFILHNAH